MEEKIVQGLQKILDDKGIDTTVTLDAPRTGASALTTIAVRPSVTRQGMMSDTFVGILKLSIFAKDPDVVRRVAGSLPDQWNGSNWFINSKSIVVDRSTDSSSIGDVEYKLTFLNRDNP